MSMINMPAAYNVERDSSFAGWIINAPLTLYVKAVPAKIDFTGAIINARTTIYLDRGLDPSKLTINNARMIRNAGFTVPPGCVTTASSAPRMLVSAFSGGSVVRGGSSSFIGGGITAGSVNGWSIGYLSGGTRIENGRMITNSSNPILMAPAGFNGASITCNGNGSYVTLSGERMMTELNSDSLNVFLQSAGNTRRPLNVRMPDGRELEIVTRAGNVKPEQIREIVRTYLPGYAAHFESLIDRYPSATVAGAGAGAGGTPFVSDIEFKVTPGTDTSRVTAAGITVQKALDELNGPHKFHKFTGQQLREESSGPSRIRTNNDIVDSYRELFGIYLDTSSLSSTSNVVWASTQAPSAAAAPNTAMEEEEKPGDAVVEPSSSYTAEQLAFINHYNDRRDVVYKLNGKTYDLTNLVDLSKAASALSLEPEQVKTESGLIMQFNRLSLTPTVGTIILYARMNNGEVEQVTSLECTFNNFKECLQSANSSRLPLGFRSTGNPDSPEEEAEKFLVEADGSYNRETIMEVANNHFNAHLREIKNLLDNSAVVTTTATSAPTTTTTTTTAPTRTVPVAPPPLPPVAAPAAFAGAGTGTGGGFTSIGNTGVQIHGSHVGGRVADVIRDPGPAARTPAPPRMATVSFTSGNARFNVTGQTAIAEVDGPVRGINLATAGAGTGTAGATPAAGGHVVSIDGRRYGPGVHRTQGGGLAVVGANVTGDVSGTTVVQQPAALTVAAAFGPAGTGVTGYHYNNKDFSTTSKYNGTLVRDLPGAVALFCALPRPGIEYHRGNLTEAHASGPGSIAIGRFG